VQELATIYLGFIGNRLQIPSRHERVVLFFKLFVRKKHLEWLILNGDSCGIPSLCLLRSLQALRLSRLLREPFSLLAGEEALEVFGGFLHVPR